MKPPKLLSFLGINGIPALVLIGILLGICSLEPAAARENGLLENLQALLLLLAFAGLLMSAPRWSRRLDWPLGLAWAVFLLSLLLRELDFDKLAPLLPLAPETIKTLRNVGLGLAWLAMGGLFFRHRHRLTTWIREGLAATWGWYLIAGGGLFVAGLPLDKKLLPLNRMVQMAIEESLEAVGTLAILLATLRWALQKPENRQPER